MYRTAFWLIGAFVAFIIAAGIIFQVATVSHRETVSGCVVVDKDRTRSGDGTSDARVYTENCGVLQVADSLTAGKWNSSDRYQSIKVGKTYDFETQGYRIPLFSQFPNIIEVHEVAG